MDQALKLHIEFLEQQLQALNQKLVESGRTMREITRIESEIRAAQLALEHYQKEHRLRH
jgi:hypothetical protein